MKIALIGNQNSGKTSLFNALTGANKKVGNWPGVTIDRVEGVAKNLDSTITDLPGIYSLSPYTSEEEISRSFVLDENIDLIINIVDSTSIERSLYLTTQLLELDTNVIIALNMYDLLKQKGININIDELSKSLGVTIVPISAKTGEGIDNLVDVIKNDKYLKNNLLKIYPDDVEDFIKKLSTHLKKENKFEDKHLRFKAVKVLEEDRDFRVLMDQRTKSQHLALEKKYDMDGEQLIASLRYDYVVNLKNKFVKSPHPKKTFSDKLDNIFLHRIWAIPIFILIMAFIYFISISVVGGLTNNLINAAFNGSEKLVIDLIFYKLEIDHSVIGLGPLIGNGLSSVGASPWAVSLITNGFIGGISAVVSFVPQLIILFICLGVLETTGYMSRIAFFLDRIFHHFGLSGKSLIPFIVGAGCSVPGIMSTRIIEDEGEKSITIALVPFIPCNAKLPIISLICAYFFSSFSALFALIFYIFAIIIVFTIAYFIKRLKKYKEHSTFISELPEYKSPNAAFIFRDVTDKTFSFLKRAGTVVVFFSIIVCVLTQFTFNFKYVDGISISVNESMLGQIGNAFGWFFYPMLGCNWSWAAAISSIQGLVAKEQVISSMQVIANLSNGGVPTEIFSSPVFSFFTPLTAFAFATFNLFSIPCVGALSAMRSEFKSTKSMFLVMLLEIIIAWFIASFIGVWGVLS